MKSGCADSIHSLQIETTSRCNLNCVTCLKPAYHDVWQSGDLDKKLFKRLVTEIEEIQPAVHLQGWGEPLVQNDFLDYVNLLKTADLPVTFTTNGTVMSSTLAGELLETGVDGITFSMAGATAVTHDKLRGDGSFQKVIQGISTFLASKRQFQVDGPRVAVSYLLTKTTVKELPKAINWCRKQGVDAFVTVALTQAGCREQLELQFLPSSLEAKRFRFVRLAANLAGMPGKMQLKMKSFAPTLTSVCDKNPINSLFISARGEVAPCVFLAPPVEGPISWFGENTSCKRESLVMGNLAHQSLMEIWESNKYQRFRDKFRERRDYHINRLGKVTYSLSGSSELESAVTSIHNFLCTHPTPIECRFCRKLDGY